ncbi:MAG: hypothetical protein JWP25_3579 [Bradyrhizobium sp.]|nr:hypothetical protein [Bradyrhizobium sp.]
MTKHGHKRRGSSMSEYRVWSQMIGRCHSAAHDSYKNYGGRGIGVCAAWRNDFTVFLRDVGARPSLQHTLDRYPDQNGNYEPGNVRWATKTEQARNKRSNVIVIIDGARMTLAEAVELSGLPYSIVRNRLHRYAWAPARAFGFPETRQITVIRPERKAA